MLGSSPRDPAARRHHRKALDSRELASTPQRSSPLRRVLFGSALVVVALAGCAVTPGASASSPEVGQCHRLDRPEQFAALSDTTPAVDCAADHTTETFQVADLTALPRLTERYPAAAERARIAEEACSADLVRVYVGALDRQALYGLFTIAFLPTPDEWAAGERWVRCDLAVVQSETTAFEPIALAFPLRDAATGADADLLLRCYTNDEKGEPVDVRCSDSHESRDVNMWMPVTGQPSDLQVVQQCVPSVSEWGALGIRPVDGVSGVLHVEDNGSLTLRCVALEKYVAG